MEEKIFDDSEHRNDYANGNEIMVTITLAEYRELIRESIAAEYEWELKLDEIKSALYGTNQRIEKLERKLF